jgi:DNA invertase Pin-like site-specific DNA recombinase
MTTRVIGYVRVSTDEQSRSGLGLDAQEMAIHAACAVRGWELVRIAKDDGGASSKTLDRPALQQAMGDLDKRRADVLMVAKLDRLSRVVAHGSQVLERSRSKKWALVALDLGIDTTTSSGEMMAHVMFSMAQYERRQIGERTSAALQAKKAAGATLGRMVTLPSAVVERILRDRAEAKSYGRIASALNAEKVPTAHGGKAWYASTVERVAKSQHAATSRGRMA